MKLSDAIRNRILDLANQNNITIHKLSLLSGIPYSTLSSFINKKVKVLLSTQFYIYVRV